MFKLLAAQEMAQGSNKVLSIIGARTKDLLILEKEMRSVSDELLVTTDDGSCGHHGLVTDVLRTLLMGDSDAKLVVSTGLVLHIYSRNMTPR